VEVEVERKITLILNDREANAIAAALEKVAAMSSQTHVELFGNRGVPYTEGQSICRHMLNMLNDAMGKGGE
jgi:hypothetical protein